MTVKQKTGDQLSDGKGKIHYDSDDVVPDDFGIPVQKDGLPVGLCHDCTPEISKK